MRFCPTSVLGVVEVLPEPHDDERGRFFRTWCAQEFGQAGLPVRFVQASVSFNSRKGTLRGLHFQWPPSREGKLVRCEAGLVHDVLLDLRPDSASYLRHVAIVLDANCGNAVYVPPGVAHGFQTLEDASQVGYFMTDVYQPDLSAGVSYRDPAFGIAWPLAVSGISDRDRDCVAFDPAGHVQRCRQGWEAP